MGACRNSFFRLNAQKTKYLGEPNSNQTRTKRPNVSIFCNLFGQKVDMSGQAVFCLNQFSTPTWPNNQIFLRIPRTHPVNYQNNIPFFIVARILIHRAIIFQLIFAQISVRFAKTRQDSPNKQFDTHLVKK